MLEGSVLVILVLIVLLSGFITYTLSVFIPTLKDTIYSIRMKNDYKSAMIDRLEEDIELKNLLISERETEIKNINYAVNVCAPCSMDRINLTCALLHKLGYDRGTDYIEMVRLSGSNDIDDDIKTKLEQS